MTGYDWLSIVIVLVCLLLSAFFAGSETALTASSRASMTRLEKHGNKRAGIVNRLLASRERLIGALLLGNNAVNIAASSLATGVLLAWFGSAGVIYATVVMTIWSSCSPRCCRKPRRSTRPTASRSRSRGQWTCIVRLLGPVLMAIEALVRWLLKHIGMTVGDDQRCCRRARNCAAQSTCSIARARWRRSTATCSAACSTCANWWCPT